MPVCYAKLKNAAQIVHHWISFTLIRAADRRPRFGCCVCQTLRGTNSLRKMYLVLCRSRDIAPLGDGPTDKIGVDKPQRKCDNGDGMREAGCPLASSRDSAKEMEVEK